MSGLLVRAVRCRVNEVNYAQVLLLLLLLCGEAFFIVFGHLIRWLFYVVMTGQVLWVVFAVRSHQWDFVPTIVSGLALMAWVVPRYRKKWGLP